MLSSINQAVIFAGGKGTRLTKHGILTPKILLEVHGKSLLEKHVEEVRLAGVRNILFILGHESDKIKKQIQKLNFSNIQMKVISEKNPRGTALAVLDNLTYFEDEFIALHGDLFHENLLKEFKIFCEYNKKFDHCFTSRWTDHPNDSNCILIDTQNKILKFYEKGNSLLPPVYGLSGMIKVSKKKIESACKAGMGIEKFIFDQRSVNLGALVSKEFIYDCGTVDRLAVINEKYSNNKNKLKCIFVDRDGVLIQYVDNLINPKQIKINVDIVNKIVNLRQGKRLICITNTPQIAKGLISFAQAFDLNQTIYKYLNNYGLKLDALYLCPHHPENGHHGEVKALKIKCYCRKPGIGMILKSQLEINLDLLDNIYLGDTELDLTLAKQIHSTYGGVIANNNINWLNFNLKES